MLVELLLLDDLLPLVTLETELKLDLEPDVLVELLPLDDLLPLVSLEIDNELTL